MFLFFIYLIFAYSYEYIVYLDKNYKPCKTNDTVYEFDAQSKKLTLIPDINKNNIQPSRDHSADFFLQQIINTFTNKLKKTPNICVEITSDQKNNKKHIRFKNAPNAQHAYDITVIGYFGENFVVRICKILNLINAYSKLRYWYITRRILQQLQKQISNLKDENGQTLDINKLIQFNHNDDEMMKRVVFYKISQFTLKKRLPNIPIVITMKKNFNYIDILNNALVAKYNEYCTNITLLDDLNSFDKKELKELARKIIDKINDFIKKTSIKADTKCEINLDLSFYQMNIKNKVLTLTEWIEFFNNIIINGTELCFTQNERTTSEIEDID